MNKCRNNLKLSKQLLKKRLRKLKLKQRLLPFNRKNFRLNWLNNKLKFRLKEKKIKLKLLRHNKMKVCKLSKFNRCNNRWNSKEWKWLKKRQHSKPKFKLLQRVKHN